MAFLRHLSLCLHLLSPATPPAQLAHGRHSQVLAALQSPQARGPFLGGLPVSKDVIEPGGLRMLSSGKEHADLRRLMMQLSPAFDPRNAVDVPLVVPAGARETASGAMRAAKASDDGWDEAWDDDVDLAVARTVAGTLFSAMFNGTLNETEVRWCMQYREFEVVVWLGQPLDQHASGLFSGDVKQLRKKIRDSVMLTPVGSRVQDTVTRMFPHLPAGSSRLAKEIVDTHKRMTDTFLFTGMLSIVSLVRSTLRRVRADPKRFLGMWAENPQAFLLETARLDPPIGSFTNILQTEQKVATARFPDNPATIPPGKTVQYFISAANQDPSVFGGHASSTARARQFDPSRADIRHSLAFGGPQWAWDKHGFVDWTVAPRACPARRLSLSIAQRVVEGFLPPKPSLVQQRTRLLQQASAADDGDIAMISGDGLYNTLGMTTWLCMAMAGTVATLVKARCKVGEYSMHIMCFLMFQVLYGLGWYLRLPFLQCVGTISSSGAIFVLWLQATAHWEETRRLHAIFMRASSAIMASISTFVRVSDVGGLAEVEAAKRAGSVVPPDMHATARQVSSLGSATTPTYTADSERLTRTDDSVLPSAPPNAVAPLRTGSDSHGHRQTFDTLRDHHMPMSSGATTSTTRHSSALLEAPTPRPAVPVLDTARASSSDSSDEEEHVETHVYSSADDDELLRGHRPARRHSVGGRLDTDASANPLAVPVGSFADDVQRLVASPMVRRRQVTVAVPPGNLQRFDSGTSTRQCVRLVHAGSAGSMAVPGDGEDEEDFQRAATPPATPRGRPRRHTMGSAEPLRASNLQSEAALMRLLVGSGVRGTPPSRYPPKIEPSTMGVDEELHLMDVHWNGSIIPLFGSTQLDSAIAEMVKPERCPVDRAPPAGPTIVVWASVVFLNIVAFGLYMNVSNDFPFHNMSCVVAVPAVALYLYTITRLTQEHAWDGHHFRTVAAGVQPDHILYKLLTNFPVSDMGRALACTTLSAYACVTLVILVWLFVPTLFPFFTGLFLGCVHLPMALWAFPIMDTTTQRLAGRDPKLIRTMLYARATAKEAQQDAFPVDNGEDELPGDSEGAASPSAPDKSAGQGCVGWMDGCSKLLRGKCSGQGQYGFILSGMVVLALVLMAATFGLSTLSDIQLCNFNLADPGVFQVLNATKLGIPQSHIALATLCAQAQVAYTSGTSRHARILYGMLTMGLDKQEGSDDPHAVVPTTWFRPLKKERNVFALPLPVEDEEHPGGISGKWIENIVLALLRQPLMYPMDDSSDPFASAHDGYVITQLATRGMTRLPPPLTPWTDMTRPEDIARISFADLAAHNLARATSPAAEDVMAALRGLLGEEHPVLQQVEFVNDFTWMTALEVRPNTAEYGAAAFFNATGHTLGLLWPNSGNPRWVPPDGPQDLWIHASFVWRSSALVGITAGNHLTETHLMVANNLAMATREQLGADHPLRRLLGIHTFQTVTINHGAISTLLSKNGFLHRATALTWNGLKSAFSATFERSSYKPISERLQAQGMADVPGHLYPFGQDMAAFEDIVTDMVVEYMHLYYANDTALQQDRQWQAFITELRVHDKGHFPTAETREQAARILATNIVLVTAYHLHVGRVTAYVSNPTWATARMRPGYNIADVHAHFQLLSIAMVTGFKQPRLMEDFSHVFLRDARWQEASDIWGRFQQRLEDLATATDAANALAETAPVPLEEGTPRGRAAAELVQRMLADPDAPPRRRWPSNGANPKHMLCSVSI